MQPREKHYKEYIGLQCNLQGPQKKATFAKMAWGWNALGTILEMLGPEKMLVSNMLFFSWRCQGEQLLQLFLK